MADAGDDDDNDDDDSGRRGGAASVVVLLLLLAVGVVAAIVPVADRVRDAADVDVAVGSGVSRPCESLLRKGSFAGPVMDAWS